MTIIAVFVVLVFLFSLTSSRLDRTIITAPILFMILRTPMESFQNP